MCFEVNFHFLLLAEFLAEALSAPQPAPGIAVLMSATRETRIEHRLLSRRSAAVVCRYVQGIQTDLKSFAGAVPVRWPTARDADRYRREVLWRSGDVPAPVPQSTCRSRSREPHPPVCAPLCRKTRRRYRQPPALSTADSTSIQPGNSFHSPATTPRRLRVRLARCGSSEISDTPRLGMVSHPREPDESDDAYPCRGVRPLVHSLKGEGRQGCKRCSDLRGRCHKWPRRSTQELAGAFPRSRAVLSARLRSVMS